jgi:hypothetical protein
MRRRKWQEAGEDCIMRSFITCTLHHVFFRVMKSRRMRLVGYVAWVGAMGNVRKIFVSKPEGKRPIGRLGIAAQ